MRLLNKLSIRFKILLIACVGCMGLIVNLGFYAWTSLANEGRLGTIQGVYFPILEDTDQAIAALEDLSPLMREAIDDVEILEDAQEYIWMVNERLDSITNTDVSQESQVANLRQGLVAYVDNATAFAERSDTNQIEDFFTEAEAVNEDLITVASLFAEYRKQNLEEFMAGITGAQETARLALWITVLISIATIVVVSIAGMVVSKLMTTSLSQLAAFARRVAGGDLDSKIEAESEDEIGQLSVTLTDMQADLRNRIELEHQSAQETEKIVEETRLVFSALASGDLHQQIENTYQGSFAVLKQDANLTVSKLSEVIEKDIDSIVQAALKGDLSQRIDMHGKTGFFEVICSGINDLVDICNQTVGDTVSVMRAVASGDLSQQIEKEYPGTFGELSNYCNATVDSLSNIVSQLDNVVQSANRGDFTAQVELEGLQGYQFEVGHGINSLMTTSAQGLDDIVRMMQALARGDLSQHMDADYQGTFLMLKDSANTTVQQLTEIVGSIRGTALQVSTGSSEISHGNTSLSERTEQQAASLEETSTAMQGMMERIEQSAANAKEADVLAQGARTLAQTGGEVVRQAVEAMEAISVSSGSITSIIGVIDEIAFQTNLLALNASVEAARAGEHGRGFAVVADEVRNLAGRSATSAKEIKDLIKDSGLKVEEGLTLSSKSAETLDEIVTSILKVTDIVAEISTESEEQVSSIAEINKALTEIDETTQQNAALVEETAAASHSLSDQASSLEELLLFFSNNDGQSGKKSSTGSIRLVKGQY